MEGQCVVCVLGSNRRHLIIRHFRCLLLLPVRTTPENTKMKD